MRLRKYEASKRVLNQSTQELAQWDEYCKRENLLG